MAVSPSFARNRFLQFVIAGYTLMWIATAISPHDGLVWAIENILVVVLLVILAGTYRRFPFSNLSYLLIALFLSLHAIGTHTGYAQSPVGFWLRDLFGLSRNPYDRVIHFAFGLLLAYPFYELVVRTSTLRGGVAHFSPVSLILAASVGFEVMESLVAEIVSPGTGPAWLGAQGDEWDMQFDLAAALLGALAVMPFTYWEARLAARMEDHE